MEYVKYNKETGDIVAKIVTAPEFVQHQENHLYGLLEDDNIDIEKSYVDNGKVYSKKVATGYTVDGSPHAIGIESIFVTGLPKPCWIKIRGTNNLHFEEVYDFCGNGEMAFTPPSAGVYHVTFIGEYLGEFDIEAIDLDAYRARRQGEVNAKKAEVLAGGLTWGENRWDANEGSLTAINTYTAAVNAGQSLPDGFYWTDYDNNNVPMTGEQLVQLGSAMVGFLFNVHSMGTTLKTQIGQAATLSELTSIDINAGWPN